MQRRTATPEKSALVSRRALIGGLAVSAALAPAGASLAQAPKIVTVLGDSITAGYGLPGRDALPVRLEAELARIGKPARVRGAGVSGDTTASGLARVGFSVQSDTAVCVVALGGNDLLQGLDPRQTRANLDQIIRKLQARKITVVLAGMRAPPAIGRSYAAEYSAVFPALAKAHNVIFYPDLLAGVGGKPALNQRDGIHPNATGVGLIVKGLAPVVGRALTVKR